MSANIAPEFATHEAPVAGVTGRQLAGYIPPNGPAEAAVAQIYSELLGLDCAAVSATTNFFDFGGTSLGVVNLKQKLERCFDLVGLPIGAILENPTVRALAAHAVPGIRRRSGDYYPVVPLQLTGRKTPLFCVHPGTGDVLGFVNLAKYFVNDRPFYALRARGFDEGDECFNTFDDMVFAYADAIRQRQPRGPYAVAGYSYGGPVAFEIAKVLESRGERVAFVGSIDMPPSLLYLYDSVGCAVNLAFLLSLIDAKQAEELPNQLRGTKPAQDPCEYLMQIAPRQRIAELDLDLPRFRVWAGVVQSLLTIGKAHRPSGRVESVTVFYADPLCGTKDEWLRGQLTRWDDFTRAPNRYVDVAGGHYTLMDHKHVATFQVVLRAEIDRALRGH